MNELAETLEEITAKALIIYSRMKRDYEEWGRLMLKAKELVPHGQFGTYLNENFPEIGERQRQRYMQAAREEKTIEQVQWRNQSPNLKTDSESEMKQVPIP